MKQNYLIKTFMLLVAFVGGVSFSWADDVTIATWSHSPSTQYTDNGSGYYTPSSGTRGDLQVAYSSRINLYGYDGSGNVQTDRILTFYSSNTSKKCGFYNTSEDRFWLGVNDNNITNYCDGNQHDNYLEISFPATGYKSVSLHSELYGFSNKAGSCHIVVSTDNGTTWYYGGSYTTGSSWNSNPVGIDVPLAVANCNKVKLRLIVDNNSLDRSDWRVQNIRVTGEAIGETSIRTISTATNNSSYGYVKVNPVGNMFEDGATITAQAIPMNNYSFAYWIDNSSNKTTDNPSTFTASEGLTSITATLKTAATLSSFTFTTINYTNGSGKRMDYPADSYTDGHQGIFNVYAPNKTNGTIEKVEWKDIDATEIQIIGTTTSLNLNGVRRAYKYWNDPNFTNPCYAQIEISTVGYTNIQIKSYLEEWKGKAYKTQKLQYSTNGTDFVDFASVDLTQTQRWHPLNGGGESAMANQNKLYIRWTYDMTGEKMTDFENGSTGESEDLRIGGIVITGEPLVALNENSNYTPEAEANVNVNLTRNISDGKWNTLVLPFSLTDAQRKDAFGENVKFAKLNSYDATNNELGFAKLTAEENTVANQPYMVYLDQPFTSYTFSGVDVVETDPTQTVGGASFIGTYSVLNSLPGGCYYISNNEWCQAASTNTIKMKGTRAYFTLSNPSGARLAFHFDEGETTAIGTIKANGETKTIADGVFYNINGQRVSHPTKGLYIVNGKKVIIK
jgi:hypothetical protein